MKLERDTCRDLVGSQQQDEPRQDFSLLALQSSARMDVGTLSNKTASAVSALDALSTEKLGKVCKYFLQTLVKGSSSVAMDENLDDSLYAVSTLLLEAARTRSSTESVKSVLNELCSNNEVITTLSELYNEHVDTLIEHIETTGIAAPSIVGIDWRLDYSIRSKNAGRENTTMFYVALRVKDRGVIRDINMMATMEELQDLLSKVRDAVKQTERVLSSSGDA